MIENFTLCRTDGSMFLNPFVKVLSEYISIEIPFLVFSDKSCTINKSNLVVIIVSSVIGSLLVVALMVFAICKLKKRQSKVIQPSSKKDQWESNTFKNAAYES